MTNEEVNRAIAEAVGWTRIWDPAFRQWTQRSPDGCNVTCDPDPDSGWDMSRIPSYSTDLNAMHEAEKKIVDWVFWRIQLSHVVGIGYAPDLDICEDIKSFASATSNQRAQAFLRTIGKYSDATHTLP